MFKCCLCNFFFAFFWGAWRGRLKGNNPSKRLDLSSTIQRRTTCELKQKLTTRTRVTCLDETEIIPPFFTSSCYYQPRVKHSLGRPWTDLQGHLPHWPVSCLDGRPALNWWRRSPRKPCSQRDLCRHSRPSAQTQPEDAFKKKKKKRTFSFFFTLQLALGFLCIKTNLRLFLLNELENLVGQLVVFRTGICEDIDEGPGQGDLQGDLNGADAHLWTVAAPLGCK